MPNVGPVQSLYNTFLGTQGQFQQSPNIYDQNQQGALNNALLQGQQGLGTSNIEGLARRNYQQNTIPLLSERFAQAGGIGSSGYQNALQGSGSELEARLAALRQGNSMDLLKLGLTPQTNQYFEEGQEGLIKPITEILTRAAAAYATGGLSEAGGIGEYFKNLFGGKTVEAGGQKFNQQKGQQPGTFNFTPQGKGTSYEGFTPEQFQKNVANQGSLGPITGGTDVPSSPGIFRQPGTNTPIAQQFGDLRSFLPQTLASILGFRG